VILLKGGLVLENENDLVQKDILIAGDKIVEIGPDIKEENADIYLVPNCWIIPGAVDVHTHLREPGFEAKETILSGSRAAAKGGVTTVMAMPNLNPVPDCIENLAIEQKIIDNDAVVHVYPYASATKGQKGKEVVDIAKLSKKVKAFSDDGNGFNKREIFIKIVKSAKRNNAMICSHAEAAGYGTTIRAEVDAVTREIEVLRELGGCKYHFCHLSTIQAFERVKEAQDEGLDISCEVTPHHLVLDESFTLQRTNFKMNPPLRPRPHRDATMRALCSGVATIIATDHAPHTVEEKNMPFQLAPNGVVGLESLLAIVYSNLVKTGFASHLDMLNWCVFNPAVRFNLPYTKIEVGSVADIAVLDIQNEKYLEEKNIISKGKSSPFTGRKAYGINQLTLVDGKVEFFRLDGCVKLWRK